MTRSAVAGLAASVLCGLGLVAPGPTAAGEDAHGVRVATAVNRVADTALRYEPYTYQRKRWRISRATGLPHWLELSNGRLSGTAPRRGRWRIALDEHGVRQLDGERRRTVLELRSVTERAARGTLLVTRGIDGRPANGGSTDPILSGDGSTLVFVSTATNLVPGIDGPVKRRVYAWHARTGKVSLVSNRQQLWIVALSSDGTSLLVSDEDTTLHLLDLRTHDRVKVAASSEVAGLTSDGRRVLYQDASGTLAGEPASLLEWDRATGRTRMVTTLPRGIQFTGAISGEGTLALLVPNFQAGPDQQAGLLDVTSGVVRDLPNLQLTSWYFYFSAISSDGGTVAVRGSGCVLAHPSPDCGTAGGFVYDVASGGLLDGAEQANLAADVTPDGRVFTANGPGQHLRLVDTVTGEQVSAFRGTPSGFEQYASISDDAARVAYVSDGHDLLRGTRRGVANVYVWVRPR